jgi:hypothetical protein
MAEITSANLNAAKVLMGPKKTRLKGAAEDFWTLGFQGDVGALLKGLQGDTMHVINPNNAFDFSLNLMPASAAVGVVLSLWDLGLPWAIAITYNAFTFNGVCSMINAGEWAATASPGPRTMTFGLSYVSGNLKAGIGSVYSTT